MTQLPPWPLKAVVISQDPDNYALNVSVGGFIGGQMPTMPVKVLTHGPRDAVRVHQPELPTPGTHGLVVFPSGDPRSGHWIGSTDPALVDASAHSPQTGGNVAYAAHWGGGYSHRGADGSLTEVFPDGTTLQIGNSVPAPTRHTLDEHGKRQRTPFTLAERVRTAATAFLAAFTHSTGASLALASSGAWSLAGAAGQTVTLSVSGGATVSLHADGSIGIVPASGQMVNVSGSVSIMGDLSTGSGAGDVTSFLNHRHSGVTAGSANSGPPVAGT